MRTLVVFLLAIILLSTAGIAPAAYSLSENSYIPCPATPLPPESPGIYPWCFDVIVNPSSLSVVASGNTTLSQGGLNAVASVRVTNGGNATLGLFVVISNCQEYTNISRCINIGGMESNATILPGQTQTFPVSYGTTGPYRNLPYIASTVYVLGFPSSAGLRSTITLLQSEILAQELEIHVLNDTVLLLRASLAQMNIQFQDQAAGQIRFLSIYLLVAILAPTAVTVYLGFVLVRRKKMAQRQLPTS